MISLRGIRTLNRYEVHARADASYDCVTEARSNRMYGIFGWLCALSPLRELFRYVADFCAGELGRSHPVGSLYVRVLASAAKFRSHKF